MQGLALDVSIDASQVWQSVGQPLTQQNSKVSVYSNDDNLVASLANATAWADAQISGESDYANRIRTKVFAEAREIDAAARAAAHESTSYAPETVTVADIPVCPFPSVRFSASLAASPATSGIGYVLTLPPYFNWSSYVSTGNVNRTKGQLVHYLMPTDDALITEAVPIQLTKGVSTLGGSPFSDELDVWQWYARTMSYDTQAALSFPYISYDIDVVRTTFSNGSATRIEASAVASAGLMSHSDAVNYFGYGFENDVLPMASCGDMYALRVDDAEELYAIAQEAGFPKSYASFLADETAALSDLLPPENVEFLGGCEALGNANDGWPAPACAAVQTFRAMLDNSGMPVTFNITDPVLQSRLRAAQKKIQNTTWTVVHQNLLSDIIAKPAVLNASYGWQNARANANAVTAMMQLQHGCGLYCVDPIAAGVGSSSSVFASMQNVQFETSASRQLGNERLLLTYVQRRRPRLICDNATAPLPWIRHDDQEYFSGDLSRVRLTSSAGGWKGSRLPAPMAVVLFRSRSWTEVSVSSTQQTVFGIIGATLGISGTIIAVLLFVKKYAVMIAEACFARKTPVKRDEPPISPAFTFNNPINVRVEQPNNGDGNRDGNGNG